jgi:hypothetical protein
MKTNYDKQADDFAKKHGLKLQILGKRRGSMWGENTERSIFKCKLSRNGKSYTFDFGQSVAAGCDLPKMYDILACLTKYDPINFKDFCAEYGYNEDSIRAAKVYRAVFQEWKAIDRLFGDIIEELQEIN